MAFGGGDLGKRLTVLKTNMRTIAKLAHLGTQGGRSPLSDVLHNVKRVWISKAGWRDLRPLQGLDGWSDQAEVAYYEDCRASRCL